MKQKKSEFSEKLLAELNKDGVIVKIGPLDGTYSSIVGSRRKKLKILYPTDKD